MTLLDLLAAPGGIEAIDLAQPLFSEMPTSATHPGFEFALRQRHGDRARPDGITGSHEMLVLGGHIGTHMDALCHVAVDGRLHGGVAVDDALVGGRYRIHGIDQVAPLACRGVLFDIPRLRSVDRLEAGQPVTEEDLVATGLVPQTGDVALIRTGWAQLWPDSGYVGDHHGVPGLDATGATWLADRGVCVVGGDTIALEHVPAGGGPTSLPVHRTLLVERGINIIEVLDLEALAQRAVQEFLFVGAPLNVLGATGAPIRPLALVGP